MNNQTLEFLSGPTTISIGAEVEDTLGGDVGLEATRLRLRVHGTDNFAVDFCEDFGAEDVSEFRLSVKTVDCFEVLSKFERVLCLQRTRNCRNGCFLDRETHLTECRTTDRTECFSICCGHTSGSQSSETLVVNSAVRVSVGDTVETRSIVGIMSPGGVAGELSLCFVEECFTAVGVTSAVTCLHCEDKTSRTGHRLNAADVVCHQVGHSTTNEGDQDGIPSTDRTRVSTLRSSFRHETKLLRTLLGESTLLVFEDSSSNSATLMIFDLASGRFVKNRSPLLDQSIERLCFHG